MMFRSPHWVELPNNGDTNRYLLIAEPVAREGVYGVYFEIPMSWICRHRDLNIIHILHQEAQKELLRRIDAKESHGEGQLAEVFRWDPPKELYDAES